jgi:hypothetical protein
LGDDTLIKPKSEDREQIEFVSWVKQNYPEDKVIHIPNGKKRSIVDAVRLKAMGVSKGVPDLFFPKLLLWVEMKREKGGSLSKEQKVVISELRSYGHTVAVCAGAEAAKEFFTDYKSLQ